MKENASHKEEGEEEIPKIASESAGIPAGEELSLDPAGGDEIDPIDRWWDDSESLEREKVRNRRIEEGEVHRGKMPAPVAPEIPEQREDAALPLTVGSEGDALVEEADHEQGQHVAAGGDAATRPKLEDLTYGPDDAGEIEKVLEPKRRHGAEGSLEDILAAETVERGNEGLEMPTFSVSPLKRGHRTNLPALEQIDELPAPETTVPVEAVKDPGKKNGSGDIENTEGLERSPEGEEAGEIDPFEGLDVLLGDQDGAAPTVSLPEKKAGCWTMVATLFSILSLLVFLGIAGVVAIAWSRAGAFGDEVTTLVSGQLEEKGIFLDFGTWKYEFPRGLVFDEVTVFDDASKERPAIKVSGIGVDVDILALVKGSGQLGSAEISLKDSNVALYEGPDLFAEISGIDGEILAGEKSVEVKRLIAQVGGLRVELAGEVNLTEPEAEVEKPDTKDKVPEVAPESKRLILDFTAFRQIQPWLTMEGAADEPAVLSLNFAVDSAIPDRISLEGNLNGKNVKWQNADFASVAIGFAILPETGELHFPNVQLGYGEGIIAASLTVDPSANLLRISQFQSTVDIVSLVTAYKPEFGDALKSVRFVDAPTIRITGEVPLADPTQADLEIRYEHGQGLVYLGGERELPLRDIRGTFKLSRGSLETNDAAADLFGGAVLVNGATRLASDASPFNGLIEISRMPLDKAAVYFGQDKVGMSGNLFLTFRGVGYKDVSKIRGGGTLRIDDASLPAFPVLGQVQKLIGGIVPAFAAKEKGSVSGAYIIESGVLLTNDLMVENGGARVITSGSLNLSSQETQFTSRAVLEPSLAAATGLADKAIVIKGSGPVSAPVINVSEFPVEFASAALGTVLGTSKESLGSLKEALAGSENPAEVISGQLEEATGIKIDPEITDLFKSFLSGGGESKPEAASPVQP